MVVYVRRIQDSQWAEKRAEEHDPRNTKLRTITIQKKVIEPSG
jgi:hypothetical protein